MREIKRIFWLFLAIFVILSLPCIANAAEYGYSVRVGLIDSGVNTDKIPIADGYNFLENNNDVTDNKGHGTKVAEIILSYAPKVELVVLKCRNLKRRIL